MSRKGPARDEATRLRVLRAIASYVERNRVPPTLEELADELGMVTTVAHRWIVRLERDGWVESLWVAGRRSPRSIRIVETGQLALALAV